MAGVSANVNVFSSQPRQPRTRASDSPVPCGPFFVRQLTTPPKSNYSSVAGDLWKLRLIKPTRLRRRPAAVMWPENSVVSDVFACAVSGAVALSLLRFWQVIAKHGVFDSKLNRKLVHISIGLVFMLCWPLFSSGHRGAVLAALVPGINIIHMLILGLGLYKDEGTVKSITRFGDYRELLKGPLYYASTITFACVYCWRTSPIGIAAICNLCAGDGLADVVGRRFGRHKLPYNKNKSYVGSFAMATAGFIASVGSQQSVL